MTRSGDITDTAYIEAAVLVAAMTTAFVVVLNAF